MEMAVAILVSILIVTGSLFTLLAAVGILRFPDLMTRMHAASKAGACGGGLLLLAAGIDSLDGAFFVRALAGVVFILVSTPISAHLLAKASRALRR